LIGELYFRFEYPVTSAQLLFAMLGMGVTLRISDFVEIMRFPKGFALGLGSVLVVSPAIALLIATLLDFSPGLTTGLILVAAVPGGTMSNILTYFAKANVPLSIALTAVATTGCLLTTPLVLQVFAGSAIGAQIEMPGARIALEIACFLLIPLAVGMLIGVRWDARRDEIAKVFIRISVGIIGLIVMGSVSADRIDATAYASTILIGIFGFCCVLFASGFGLLRLTGFPARDAVAAGIETSFRNISLALLVKASVWPAIAGVPDPFADEVFFVVLFYGSVAFLVSLPPLLIHRRSVAGSAGARDSGS
jgi:BASS family bile acid:Na+ symporter